MTKFNLLFSRHCFVLFVLFTIIAPFTYANSSIKTTNIGNFKSINTDTKGLTIRTDVAIIKLNVYQDDVVRVRISKQAISDFTTEAVIQKSTMSFSRVSNEPTQVLLFTQKLKIVVDKKPIRIRFYTIDGKLLSSDYQDLGVFWQGDAITCTRNVQSDEKFLGLGQKGRDINRRGYSYTNANFESAHYVPTSDPLYSSFPVFLSVHANLTYGIFVDNTHKTLFNMAASTNDEYYSFTAVDGNLDYYFFGTQGLTNIIEKYSWLTGKMNMPPLWMLGNQQSRWSYAPDKMVLNVANSFRERKIPLDAMYLDIDYMENFKVFTWGKKNFSNPKQTIDQLNALNLHAITIVDPGVKVEKDYFVYEEMLRNNLFVKYASGKPYTATVWPGNCHFPDFTMAKTREFWGNYHKELINKGIEGFWNDMNEPSAWGNSVPDFIECNYDGKPASFLKARNVYALGMAQATYEGTRKLLNGKRTFVLSRSGFSGMQRYAAMWSGDTESSDDYLFLVVRQMLSMGASGMPYMGFDTPGFSGNPTGKQFLRWLNVAAYSPLLRNHHCIGTNMTEPWAYGEGVESSARQIIENRYKLIPYIYSTFYQAAQTGRPICRMLPLEYSFDNNVYLTEFQHQYMFGDNIMVVPTATDQKFAKVYLPAGKWYKMDTQQSFEGPLQAIVDAPENNIPIFVKESGIIPTQSLVQSTNEAPSDTLNISIYFGSKPNSFNYYEDDGKTYEYESGKYYQRNINFTPENMTIELSEKKGSYASKFKFVKIELCHFSENNDVYVENQMLSLHKVDRFKKFFIFKLNNDQTIFQLK